MTPGMPHICATKHIDKCGELESVTRKWEIILEEFAVPLLECQIRQQKNEQFQKITHAATAFLEEPHARGITRGIRKLARQ